MGRADRLYISVIIFLVIAIIIGGVTLATKRGKSQPVEISLSQTAQTEAPQESSEVYVGGAVANPGIYSLNEGDTLQTLLYDVGVEPDADLSHIEIYIPREGEEQSPQKIDINRAEPWLLEALPGIGEITAKAIVDYRTDNGPFKRIEDLLQVKGIGEGTLEKIKDYITVSD